MTVNQYTVDMVNDNLTRGIQRKRNCSRRSQADEDGDLLLKLQIS